MSENKLDKNEKVISYDKLRQKDAAQKRIGVLKTYKLFIGGKFPRTESGHFYELKDSKGTSLANVCLGSRKDIRDAVTIARAAQAGWAKSTAMLKGQILYRMAEMLEARASQFEEELDLQNVANPRDEVRTSIDRLIAYAGWSDKYQQVFSTVNPVASSHFNFSTLEPTGVVAIVAPEESPLLGLISVIAPAIVGGNSVVVTASYSKPLSAITFAEVLATSDLPAGVINIITGLRADLVPTLASHMDVNALVISGKVRAEEIQKIKESASLNVKRVIVREVEDWKSESTESPYWILDTQETKTTWHPIGL